MARKVKKTKSTKTQSASSKADFANRREILRSSDSYKSLVYGVLTVIILFVVGFSMVRLFTGGPKGEVDNEAVSTQQIQDALNNSQTGYTVQEGETLWSIAEDKYGSGFEWYRIAEANNISDVSNLKEGASIIIPDTEDLAMAEPTTIMDEEAPQSSPAASPTKAPSEVQSSSTDGEKINGSTYTIQEGDDLWDIAMRAYGDGYKWVEIAKANNLENPDIIHVDNTLKLPGK